MADESEKSQVENALGNFYWPKGNDRAGLEQPLLLIFLCDG